MRWRRFRAVCLGVRLRGRSGLPRHVMFFGARMLFSRRMFLEPGLARFRFGPRLDLARLRDRVLRNFRPGLRRLLSYGVLHFLGTLLWFGRRMCPRRLLWPGLERVGWRRRRFGLGFSLHGGMIGEA